jgi:hypothetical protein
MVSVLLLITSFSAATGGGTAEGDSPIFAADSLVSVIVP